MADEQRIILSEDSHSSATTSRMYKKAYRSTLVRKGTIALADQALVSGTKFVISLALARYLGLTEYGNFILAYGILTLANYLQSSLILVPMSVIGSPLEGQEMKRYLGATGLTQIALGTFVALGIIASSSLFTLFSELQGLAGVLFAMGIAALPTQLQEFFRRLLYARQKAHGAFINDLVCYVGQMIGLFVLVKLNVLSSSNAFWLISAAAMTATAIGFFQCTRLLDFARDRFAEICMRNWHYGKWLLLSMISQWISGQVYLYFSAIFLDVAAAGVLGAMRNLYGIINMTLAGMRNVLHPYCAEILEKYGLLPVLSLLNRTTMLGSLLIIAYIGVIYIFYHDVVRWLYDGKYNEHGIIFLLMGIQALISYLSYATDTVLVVLKKTRRLFRSSLFASLFSIIPSILLIKSLNLLGACAGMILTQVVMAFGLYYAYRVETKEYYNRGGGGDGHHSRVSLLTKDFDG